MPTAVPRTPPRNIQVYNPTTSSLNVRWEPASGQVQQYRVAYAPLTAVRPKESVSPDLFQSADSSHDFLFDLLGSAPHRFWFQEPLTMPCWTTWSQILCTPLQSLLCTPMQRGHRWRATAKPVRTPRTFVPVLSPGLVTDPFSELVPDTFSGFSCRFEL